MYQAHFGLRHRPFRSTPDRDAYYPAGGHEAALGRLLQAIAADEGLALVTGEPGIGKTLLCHRLLEHIDGSMVCAFLTNSHIQDRADLFQALLYDLSLPHERRGEQELRLALTDHLLKNFAAGRRNLIVIDEAQHLDADLLEELRLLGNLEGRHGKAVQVILAAQPGVEKTLARPELASLRQRLVARAVLEPLGVHEAADYLAHQLRLAGSRPEKILSDEALEVLARGCQGVPRLLNQAAHQSLSLAQQADMKRVDAEVALEALGLLGLELEPVEESELAVVGAAETAGGRPLPDEESADQGSVSGIFASPRRPA